MEVVMHYQGLSGGSVAYEEMDSYAAMNYSPDNFGDEVLERVSYESHNAPGEGYGYQSQGSDWEAEDAANDQEKEKESKPSQQNHSEKFIMTDGLLVRPMEAKLLRRSSLSGPLGRARKKDKEISQGEPVADTKHNSCFYESDPGDCNDKEGTNSDSDDDENEDQVIDWERQWNTEYQEALALEDEAQRYQNLFCLSNDFVETASMYGRIIISELFLPNDKKTIKPIDVGGVAGGQKYLVKGIFFKLAYDMRLPSQVWMYGGDKRRDEYAIKASGHELKSTIHMQSARIPGLNVPMVCTVDFRGFRLLCSTVLEIDKTTLAYGSNDGGITVHQDNKELKKKVKAACKYLNLKKHRVENVNIYGPGDMEGHVDHKGRFYVIDLARLFPPEAPKSRKDRSIYYYLLRPELVKNYPVPLCSDAFSGWGRSDPEYLVHEREVKECTELLHSVAIPGLAACLTAQVEKLKSEITPFTLHKWIDLSTEFHSRGVNMRHLGRVRQHVVDSIQTIQILLVEMVARIFKNSLREQLREKMREIKVSSEDPYRLLIVNFLNTILKHHPFTTDKRPIAWLNFIQEKLKEKYGIQMSETDEKLLLEMQMRPIIKRFCQKMGIVLSASAKNWLKQPNREALILVYPDILSVNIVTKHMNTLWLAEGMVHYLNAVKCIDENPAGARTLLLLAEEKLTLVIKQGYNDAEIHHNLALCYRLLVQTIAMMELDKYLYVTPMTGYGGTDYYRYLNNAIVTLEAAIELSGGGTGAMHLDLGICFCFKYHIEGVKKHFALAFAKDPSLKERVLKEWVHLNELQQPNPHRSSCMVVVVHLTEALANAFPDCVPAHTVRALSICQTLLFELADLPAFVLYGKDIYDDIYDVCKKAILESAEKAVALDSHAFDEYFEQALQAYQSDSSRSQISPGFLALIFSDIPLLQGKLAKLCSQLKAVTLKSFMQLARAHFLPVDFEQIGQVIPNLTTLNASDLQITSAAMSTCITGLAKHCPKLKMIHGLAPKFDADLNPGFTLLADRLEELTVERVRDWHLVACAPLRKLRLLSIKESSDLKDETFITIVGNNPGLQRVSITDLPTLSDASLDALATHCAESLIALRLGRLCEMTEDGFGRLFHRLSEVKKLKFLDLYSICVNPTFIAELPSSIEELEIYSCFNKAINQICDTLGERLVQLRHLTLDCTEIQPEGLTKILARRSQRLETLLLNQSFPLWGAPLECLSMLSSLSHLSLSNTRAQDADLLIIAGCCTQLRFVNLFSVPATEKGIVPLLEANKDLRTCLLSPRRCNVDSILAALPAGLRELDVSNFISTDTHLKMISYACPYLRHLSICNSDFSDHGLKYLADHASQLEILNVSNCYQITDVGLSYLGAGCSSLKVLYMAGLAKSTHNGRKYICKHLPHVHIVLDSDYPHYLPPLPEQRFRMLCNN